MEWLPPESAPRDGTPFLGDFGWPWACFAVWDEHDQHWCIATVQRSPMETGPDNTWLECDTEDPPNLRQWHPLPNIPRRPTG